MAVGVLRFSKKKSQGNKELTMKQSIMRFPWLTNKKPKS
jgi:hypothetical protein